MFLHTLPHREYCIRRPSTWHETRVFIPKPSLISPFQIFKVHTLHWSYFLQHLLPTFYFKILFF